MRRNFPGQFQEVPPEFRGSTAAFPTTRNIKRLPLSEDRQELINEWFISCGIILGPVIPDEAARAKVTRLLYTYREPNATELDNIQPTDLYEHPSE